MKWLTSFLNKYVKAKQNKKGGRQVNRKVIRKKAVVNSFAKVKQDMGALDQHAKELLERVEVLETTSRNQEQEVGKATRWIQQHNQQITELRTDLTSTTFRLERLETVSHEVAKLQKEFAELMRKLEAEQIKDKTRVRVVEPIRDESNEERLTQEEVSNEQALEHLSPYTRQALFLIVKMMHESGKEWLALADVTAQLYPDRDGSKIHNLVANVLRPLYEHGLLEKRRSQNYVFIKPTERGLSACRDQVKENGLKKVDRVFEKIQAKKRK